MQHWSDYPAVPPIGSKTKCSHAWSLGPQFSLSREWGALITGSLLLQHPVEYCETTKPATGQTSGWITLSGLLQSLNRLWRQQALACCQQNLGQRSAEPSQLSWLRKRSTVKRAQAILLLRTHMKIRWTFPSSTGWSHSDGSSQIKLLTIIQLTA